MAASLVIPSINFPPLLNTFAGLALVMGERYFARPEFRQHSRAFYTALDRLADAAAESHKAAGALSRAETLTRRLVQPSLASWRRRQSTGE